MLMIVHRYWEGPDNPDTCSSHLWMPFEVRSWTFNDLPTELQDFLQEVPDSDGPRHRANLARYWILANNDGIWADMDVFPRNRSFVVYNYPNHAWAAGVRGEACGCLLGGDRRVWARIFEYACLAPLGECAVDTSGKQVLTDFVNGGLLQLQSGLLSADTRSAPFRHLWLTANERRRNGQSVSHGL